MPPFKTREVIVGQVGIGGNNPIRIQSMTTSPTCDIEATVTQILRLADAGCELARVTVQGKKEAEACEKIKNLLIQKKCTIPLIADIHFYPPAALLVVEFVEKVRINPGNFVDPRASFKTIDYDDASYKREVEKIETKLVPLIEKCKKLKKPLRIGVNHGSLSDRIMNRYGDTPLGMVQSALEFASVCRKYAYHDLIFSMKSSHPFIMVQAYRLLVSEMIRLNWDYPLHLGVTEAGEGEDGRVKSAIGIGALLLDGIGDTIRLSLTEDPWNEIPACKRLVQLSKNHCTTSIPVENPSFDLNDRLPQKNFKFAEKQGLHPNGTVILKIKEADLLKPSFFKEIGCSIHLGDIKKTNESADILWIETPPKNEQMIRQLETIGIPIIYQPPGSDFTNCIVQDSFVFFHPTHSPIQTTRHLIDWLHQKNISLPLILALECRCSEDDLPLDAGAQLGALLCDQMIDGICLMSDHPLEVRRRLSFALLQAARMRMIKTDFISCPGCGRTLFDLQETSKRIREKTAHLPGVKIAIMGCIVNGPGEMADADFGYVGSKSGKVDLYVGKTCVERDIDFADADLKLIELIKAHGKWIRPLA